MTTLRPTSPWKSIYYDCAPWWRKRNATLKSTISFTRQHKLTSVIDFDKTCPRMVKVERLYKPSHDVKMVEMMIREKSFETVIRFVTAEFACVAVIEVCNTWYETLGLCRNKILRALILQHSQCQGGSFDRDCGFNAVLDGEHYKNANMESGICGQGGYKTSWTIVSDVAGSMYHKSVCKTRHFTTLLDLFSGFLLIHSVNLESKVPGSIAGIVQDLSNMLNAAIRKRTCINRNFNKWI